MPLAAQNYIYGFFVFFHLVMWGYIEVDWMRTSCPARAKKRDAVLIDMTAWVTAKIKPFFIFFSFL